MSDFSHLFNSEKPFWCGVSYIFDLLILSLLWIVTSIPIVTIGASTTAVYFVVLRMDGKTVTRPIKDFFHSFGRNFKQATLIWLLILLVSGLLFLDGYASSRAYRAGVPFAGAILVMTVVLGMFFLIVVFYVFPYLSRFEGKTMVIFKNAFYLAFRYFWMSLLLLAINAAVLVALYYCLNLFPFAEGVIAGLSGVIFRRMFRPYLQKSGNADPDL